MGGSREKTMRIYSESFGASTKLQSQDIHVVSVHHIPRRRLCGGQHIYTLTTDEDEPPLSRSGGRITDDECLNLEDADIQSPDSFHHVKEQPKSV
jgi:hypothetical protein